MHKTATTDDKRLQSTLKRIGVNTIPGIEEVNIFQGEEVINFVNPKGARRAWRSKRAAQRAPRVELRVTGGCESPSHGRARGFTCCAWLQVACLPCSCTPTMDASSCRSPMESLLRAVQASIAANTYVVSGPSQTKSMAGGLTRQACGSERRAQLAAAA